MNICKRDFYLLCKNICIFVYFVKVKQKNDKSVWNYKCAVFSFNHWFNRQLERREKGGENERLRKRKKWEVCEG